jgi:hypothetical protein
MAEVVRIESLDNQIQSAGCLIRSGDDMKEDPGV